MSEQKRKIGFTVACVNEFANRHRLSSKEDFQYLFQFKGIAFIKKIMMQNIRWILKQYQKIWESYVKKWGYIMRLYHGSNIVIDNINLAMYRMFCA